MAASVSADPAKIVKSSMLKSARAVDCVTTSSIERSRATGSPPLAAELLLNRFGERKGLGARADNPRDRRDAEEVRAVCIGQLRPRDV